MKYEFKKIFSNPILILLTGLVFFLTVGACLYNISDRRVEVFEDGEKKVLEGRAALDYLYKNSERTVLDEKTIENIFTKYDGKSYDYVAESFAKTDPSLLSHIYSIYKNQMFDEEGILHKSRVSTFDIGKVNKDYTMGYIKETHMYTEKELANTDKKLSKINKKVEHGFTGHFRNFFNTSYIGYFLFAFLVIVISVYLVSLENWYETDIILKSIKNKATLRVGINKIGVIFIFVSGIFILINLVMVGLTIAPYKFSNLDMMIQSSVALLDSNMDLNYGELIALMMGLTYISTLSLSIFAGFLASLVRSSKVSLLIVLATIGILFPRYSNPLIDKIVSILPQAGIFSPRYLTNFYSYEVFGVEISNVNLIIITSLILIFASIAGILIKSARKN
ncbi:hypothetical protein [Anaerococcus urinomassiliensis]|uniref:hypothetical protein n=1 Tax=Anaerococcus urinomassiliensis TaxID=1745712 RepID=UPI00093CE156|nr:hypothetical protein [Anaerococcus urinomassiliensis]